MRSSTAVNSFALAATALTISAGDVEAARPPDVLKQVSPPPIALEGLSPPPPENPISPQADDGFKRIITPEGPAELNESISSIVFNASRDLLIAAPELEAAFMRASVSLYPVEDLHAAVAEMGGAIALPEGGPGVSDRIFLVMALGAGVFEHRVYFESAIFSDASRVYQATSHLLSHVHVFDTRDYGEGAYAMEEAVHQTSLTTLERLLEIRRTKIEDSAGNRRMIEVLEGALRIEAHRGESIHHSHPVEQRPNSGN